MFAEMAKCRTGRAMRLSQDNERWVLDCLIFNGYVKILKPLMSLNDDVVSLTALRLSLISIFVTGLPSCKKAGIAASGRTRANQLGWWGHHPSWRFK